MKLRMSPLSASCQSASLPQAFLTSITHRSDLDIVTHTRKLLDGHNLSVGHSVILVDLFTVHWCNKDIHLCKLI